MREVHYERRLVAFYDVLGWRDKIQQAENDPVALARLRNVISFYALIAKKEKTNNDLRISTFSDNVVMSIDPKASSFLFILLGFIQIVAVIGGCLLRGGVTIGNIAHDNDVVFGPALNRAYDIERLIAVHPRIVIDPEQTHELANAHSLLNTEGDLTSVDPFRRSEFETVCRFVTMWRMERGEVSIDDVENEFTKEVMDTFTKMFRALASELARPLPEKEWGKVAWLFDRMAKGFRIPDRAAEYRVLPPAS
jgi:hypothetical protein